MKKRMALAALLVSGAAAFADCGWEFALGDGEEPNGDRPPLRVE